MPQRTLYPRKGYNNTETVVFEGIFRPGTGAAAATEEIGNGCTVARTAAGIWLLTIPIAFRAFVCCLVSHGYGAAADYNVCTRARSVANRTIEIINLSAGADTDFAAAGADSIISYHITVQTGGILMT